MAKHKLSGCVVNLSGGIDSAVTLGLMKYAMEMKDSPVKRILSVAQPIHSSDWALQRGESAVMHACPVRGVLLNEQAECLRADASRARVEESVFCSASENVPLVSIIQDRTRYCWQSFTSRWLA
jgi:hypothetical protein